MPLSLLRQAEAAEDDASALQRFLDEIPQRDADIAPSIRFLIEIAAALRDVQFNLAEEFSRSTDLPARMHYDIDLILRSLFATHKFLDHALFQQTRLTTYSGRRPYQFLWDEVDVKFRDEGFALHSRLEMYSSFLKTIIDGVKRYALPFAPWCRIMTIE